MKDLGRTSLHFFDRVSPSPGVVHGQDRGAVGKTGNIILYHIIYLLFKRVHPRYNYNTVLLDRIIRLS